MAIRKFKSPHVGSALWVSAQQRLTSVRRSMIYACGSVACCIIVETLMRWPSNHLLSYLLIPVLALASLIVLLFVSQSGAWLVVTLYCVGLVSPFPMSYSYSLAMLIAVTLIWTDSRLASGLAATLSVIALMIDRKLLFGLGLSDSVVISFAYCVFALTIGVASRWHVDRARLAEQVRRQTEREHIARVLHDRISNDLAYAIMRIDRNLTSVEHNDEQDNHVECGAHVNTTSFDTTAELHELRAIIDHALCSTHQVITTLDGMTAPLSSSMLPSTKATVERIAAYVDEQEDRLRTIGFGGQTTLSNTLPSLSDRSFDELSGLLSEIYTNIAKHGDPTHGYVVSIATNEHSLVSCRVETNPAIIITATNIPRQYDATEGLGSGLERYRRMGVDMTTRVEDGQWVLSARFAAK